MTAVQQYWLIPPADYKLVSDLYPYDIIEEAALSSDWLGGMWYSMFEPEEVGLGADFVSAELLATLRYITYTTQIESADLSANFIGGDLVVVAPPVVYKTYTMQTEAADLSADFTGGVLVVTTAYVTYTNPVEAANLSADFTGGVLI